MSWYYDAYNQDYTKNAQDREQARKRFLREEKKKTTKAQKLWKLTIKL